MRRYGGWLVVLGMLLIPIIGHAGEAGKPLWVSEDDEAQLYQGDLLLHVILSHATDCRANVTNARAEQLCRDLDDGQLWRCVDPTAGGSPDFCDSTGEWAGGLPLFLESDGTLTYYLDSGTQKVQICNTAKTLCHRWTISDTDGPVYDGVCAGGDCHTTITVKSGKDLTVTYATTDVLQMLAGTNEFKATSNGWISPRSGTGSPVTALATSCDAAGEAGRPYIQTDAADASMWWVCKGTSGWKNQTGGGGGGSNAPIRPYSAIPVTAGMVAECPIDGVMMMCVADATTLTADAIWRLVFQMPDPMPTGCTWTIVVDAAAALAAGTIKINPKWSAWAVGAARPTSPLGETTTADTVTGAAGATATITFGTGDTNQWITAEWTMNATALPADGQKVLMDLTIENTGTDTASSVGLYPWLMCK